MEICWACVFYPRGVRCSKHREPPPAKIESDPEMLDSLTGGGVPQRGEPEPLLTDEETRLVRDLGDWWNRYVSLPEHHPNELGESAAHVHALQHTLMARAAIRSDPGRYTPMNRLRPHD